MIVEVLEILEDSTYFGILLDHTGTPLDVLLQQVPQRHWLRDLDSARARILLWRNAIQLTRALGLVHAQELVHGRLDTSAVMTEGADIWSCNIWPANAAPRIRWPVSWHSPPAGCARYRHAAAAAAGRCC